MIKKISEPVIDFNIISTLCLLVAQGELTDKNGDIQTIFINISVFYTMKVRDFKTLSTTY